MGEEDAEVDIMHQRVTDNGVLDSQTRLDAILDLFLLLWLKP